MNSLERIKNARLPTGIYSLKDGTLVSAELKAYAAAIDSIAAEIEELRLEMFPKTASGYGLDRTEHILALPTSAAGVEERRKRILALTPRINGKWNPTLFAKGLFTELLPNYSMMLLNGQATVRFVKKGTAATEDFVPAVQYLLDYFPAFLRFVSNQQTPLWSEIDSAGRSFGEIDLMGLPWELMYDQTI